MADDTASANLQHVLEHRNKRVHKPRSTVLFRRGEKASGMFVVLSGEVSLDLGVDSAFCRTYGPGALVGLPSTLNRLIKTSRDPCRMMPYFNTRSVSPSAGSLRWNRGVSWLKQGQNMRIE